MPPTVTSTFWRSSHPGEIGGWRASLDAATASRLTAAIEASPNRQAPRRRMSPVWALLAILASSGLLALSGWVIFGVAGPAANVTSGGNTSEPRQTSTGGQATTSAQQ